MKDLEVTWPTAIKCNLLEQTIKIKPKDNVWM